MQISCQLSHNRAVAQTGHDINNLPQTVSPSEGGALSLKIGRRTRHGIGGKNLSGNSVLQKKESIFSAERSSILPIACRISDCPFQSVRIAQDRRHFPRRETVYMGMRKGLLVWITPERLLEELTKKLDS